MGLLSNAAISLSLLCSAPALAEEPSIDVVDGRGIVKVADSVRDYVLKVIDSIVKFSDDAVESDANKGRCKLVEIEIAGKKISRIVCYSMEEKDTSGKVDALNEFDDEKFKDSNDFSDFGL